MSYTITLMSPNWVPDRAVTSLIKQTAGESPWNLEPYSGLLSQYVRHQDAVTTPSHADAGDNHVCSIGASPRRSVPRLLDDMICLFFPDHVDSPHRRLA